MSSSAGSRRGARPRPAPRSCATGSSTWSGASTSRLIGATAALLAWAQEQGLTWDAHDDPEGTAWGGRLEVFLTNPMEQPDMSQWDTDLVFKLAD